MRLIDADSINFEEVFGGKSDFAKDLREAAQELIGRQPTAFDKEKVIEELKGEIELCVTHPLYPGRYIKKDRTVEIVEKGGIK